ncbi:MAG: hypothetical protein IMZ47_08635 [Firmicutes bacterium]|nr:hypothetical protein [Bacillota bacterium]
MKVRDIVLIGLLSACITAGKLALSFIPNVEIVTLLFIVFTVTLGIKRSFFISIIFVTTEILLYGFSTWVLGYYIVWPVLVLITALMSKTFKTEYGYAAIAGIFGLAFGLFFAITESFFYGYAYGLTYWVRGLPFDILHGAANYIIVLVLFKPLSKMLAKQVW